MMTYVLRLPAVVLLTSIVSSLALNCSAPRRSLPPDSCLLPPSASTANFDDSQHRCIEEGFTGLSVVTDQQFANLALYAQVLGKQNQFYWLGYSYDAQSVLRDVSQRVVANDSAIALPANYGQPLLDASPGMCIAIDGNGMLHRRPCADLLSSFCQVLVQAPSANITVNPSRFVTDSVTLTCSVTGSDVAVTWMASLPSSSQPQPLNDPNTLVRNPFAADEHAGTYYCVASNELGSFVSDPVVLVAGPDNSTGNEVTPTVNIIAVGHGPPYRYPFGVFLLLKCNFTAGVTVQWFINGRPVLETSRSDQLSSLELQEVEGVGLQEEGYYQCFAITAEGRTAGGSLLVEAQAGRPGGIDTISARPYSTNELFVSWLCPQVLNTHDVALLRYCISFHKGVMFNINLARYVMDVLPVLLNGSESNQCIVEAVVPGLETGTTYAVKVTGVTTSGMDGMIAPEFAVGTTYGTVPPPITDLKVTRSPDNKEVQATWGIVKTTPPLGYVSRYRIEYRDSSKGSISTVFRARKYNYLLIQSVINANFYEVRVSSGIVVQSDPAIYSYSEFSAWVKVDGIRIISPTESGLSTLPSRVGAVAAGVVVGVLVTVLILAILLMGIFCCFYRRVDPARLDKKGTSHSTTLGLDNTPGYEQKLPD